MSEYKDSDGNEIDLYRLINKEPEWAVNIIEKLKAENKALKETKLTCEDCGRTFVYIQKVEVSRDELLKWCILFSKRELPSSIMTRLGLSIEIAEALKDKEA